MKTNAALAAVVGVVVVAATVMWWSGRTDRMATAEPAVSTDLTPPTDSSTAVRASTAVEAIEPGEGDRRAVEVVEQVVAETPPLLVGRVQDAELQGVPGIPVRFERLEDGVYLPLDDEGGVTTDEAGSFSMHHSGELGRLVAENESYTTIMPREILTSEPPDEAVIIVAPRRTYAGVVTDEQGTPLAGVMLFAQMEESEAIALSIGVQRSRQRHWAFQTDDAGRFELVGVGWTPGTRLEALPEGFERYNEPLPEASTTDLEIVLTRVVANNTLEGQVVDLFGAAVPDAWVALGAKTTRTDEEGWFVIAKEPGEAESVLRAVKKGYLPSEPISVSDDGSTDAVVLVLGPSPLSISGRVIDEEGSPVRGARVWSWDGTTFGQASVGGFSGRVKIEALMTGDGGDSIYARHATTDAEGRFEIRSLLPRPYELQAADPESMELAQPVTVEGGSTGVILLLNQETPARRVAGRVVRFDGSPVGGAYISANRRMPGSERRIPYTFLDLNTLTDDQGHFELGPLCVERTLLQVSGEEIAFTRFNLDTSMDVERLQIRVLAECKVQVVLEHDPEEADGFYLLNEEGERLTAFVQWGLTSVSSSANLILIEDGVSEVALTDESARTLVLRKKSEEVRRVPIRLQPGEVTVLRL